MISINSKHRGVQILFILICFVLLVICSCNSTPPDVKNGRASGDASNEAYKSDWGQPYVAGYSPLTFQNYQTFTSSSEHFSYIRINHKQILDNNILQISVDAGSLSSSVLFNSIEEYRGSLYKVDGETTPAVTTENRVFFPPQHTAAFFAYLETNQAYFFNGDEYQGLTIPFDSPGTYISHEPYMFALTFYEPGEKYYALSIQKCMDVPDPILQGLIDIIESDILPLLEE